MANVWYIYIYANIGGVLMVNVTIYSIHGSYGIGRESHNEDKANLGNTIVLVCLDEHPELLALLVSTEGDSAAFDSTKHLRGRKPWFAIDVPSEPKL